MPAQSSNRQNARTEPMPERLLLPGEYRAPEGDELTEQDLAALATERPLVRASGLGDFPGDDLGEAMARVEGELGSPHLPFLPHLPARGWRSTPLARTLAVCEGLAFDGASFGWRMVHSGGRGARESALAQDRLLSDINLLADRVGAQKKRFGSGQDTAPVYKIQLVGPLTLAASIYLPGGERAISDAGASRDLLESFLEGLERWVESLREALQAPRALIAVQLNESEFQRLLEGSIPTVSGFRSLSALQPHYYQQVYRRVAERFAELNLQLILDVDGTALKPVQELKLLSQARPTLDALALVKAMQVEGAAPCALLLHPDRARPKGPGTLHVPPLSDPRSWEPVAQLLEANAQLWLPVVTSVRVPDQVRRLYSLWREVGLESAQLSAVGLMPDERIQGGSASAGAASGTVSVLDATASLARVTECARALAECAV
ncbi:MAG: methionine synthase [Rothia sp.]|uniref:methionine synthase n=1 Tax=Rothia sp. (in: high G+C Gram-positive bacteria) TaxID=1885016 RepID=UPI001CAA9BEB|nr:methionine synthase [Rothia sp. (in: high G+C Gram-positive bacteria)]MBF1679975.1 methionine synthase [Rothia sp. (in: high G+C Gram-positive bacteria)]